MGTKLHTFASSFKRLRKAAGFTQQTFADEFHFSLETVRNWEQGRSFPELKTAFKLCEFFGCSMDHLFGLIPCKTHDAQFIYEQTGLTEDSQHELAKLKNTPSTMLVLNHLIRNQALLSRLVGYYAYAFEGEARARPFLLVPFDKRKLDHRLFFSDVLDMLPQDRNHFYEEHSSSATDAKSMVFELIHRCSNHNDIVQLCQLIYDDIYKNKSSLHDDKQLIAIAEFLEAINFDSFTGIFDSPLSEYYDFSILQ